MFLVTNTHANTRMDRKHPQTCLDGQKASTDLPGCQQRCHQTQMRRPEEFQSHDDDCQRREQNALEEMVHQLSQRTTDHTHT